MDLAPSVVVAGRYRVVERLAAGGMGEVWVGEHVGLGMRIAIKRLLPKASASPEIVARFRREVLLVGRVQSAHVARVVDFVDDETYGVLLVLEFVDGEVLGDRLKRGRVEVEEAIELGIDIASALADLHRVGIVHRDVKPANILLQPTADGGRRAVIVDFGVSRLVGDAADSLDLTTLTAADMALGTLEYMAPEQVLSARSATAASDLYSVGAILFRAVAGQHVFGPLRGAMLARAKIADDAPPLMTGRDDRVAQGFRSVVARAIGRLMEERYQSAEDLARDLAALRSPPARAATRAPAPAPSAPDDDTPGGPETVPMPTHRAPPRAEPAPVAEAAPPAPRLEPTARDVVVEPTARGDRVSVTLPDAALEVGDRMTPAPAAIARPVRTGVPVGFVVVGLVLAAGIGVAVGARLARPAPSVPAASAASAAP
jgi:serine/threonine-protein kinase